MSEPTRHDLYQLPLLRRATGRFRVLPGFIILGAQKAGTTTIYDNLIKHPAVMPCDIKEVHFFDKNWDKGENWYRGHFPLRLSPGELTGEGSPYYLFHPQVPHRIKQLCPQARLIVVLRNPVERAYSHYQHEKRKGREPLSFEDALAEEPKRIRGEADKLIADSSYQSFAHQHYSYAARGQYADQLEMWFRVFPREQFLILESGELNHNFNRSFQSLYEFLNIPSLELPQPKRSNVGTYDKISPVTEAGLKAYFAPHNERLYELLGRQYNW